MGRQVATENHFLSTLRPETNRPQRTAMQMMQVRWSLGSAQGKRKSTTSDYQPPNKRLPGELVAMANTML